MEALSREFDSQSQSRDIDADASQHLAGPTLDIQDPDQKVLRLHLWVASLKRQAGGSVDRAASSGRELRIP